MSETPEPAATHIPKARFDQVVTERNELRAQLEAATTTATTSATQLEAAQAQVTGFQSELATERLKGQAYRAGIQDNDTVDFALFKYDRLEGDKPAFSEWLSSDTAPTPIRAALTQTSKPPPPPAEPPPPPAEPPPPPAPPPAEPPPTPSSTPVLPDAAPNGKRAITVEYLDEITTEEYEARRPEVLEFLSSQ